MPVASRRLPLLALVLVVLAAWLPSVRPYVDMMDDLPLIQEMNGGLRHYLGIYPMGVWRLAQQPMMAYLTRPFPFCFPAVAVVTHAATAVAFFLALVRLTHRVGLALAAAIVAFAFPWGFQAVLWAAAFGNVVTTLAFWACCLLLLTARRHRRPLVAVATYAIATAALFTQDNMVFCFPLLAAVVLVPRGRRWPARPWSKALRVVRRRYDAWAPAAATATYLLAFVLTGTRRRMVKKVAVHWATFLSVPARQYTNLYVFGVWRHATVVRYAAGHLWPLPLAAAAVTACVALVVTWRAFARRPARPARPLRQSGGLLFGVALLMGAAAVFVAAGGFSVDSRKKYEIVPILALLAAAAVARTGDRWSSSRGHRRAPAAAAVAVVAVAIPTTWLVCGTYAGEALRYHAIYEALVAHPAKAIDVTWEPDLYPDWTTLPALIGGPMDTPELLNYSLIVPGSTLLADPPGPADKATALRITLRGDDAVLTGPPTPTVAPSAR